MENYFSAICKMEQTVMFPSLLLGVSCDQQDHLSGPDSSDQDLFELYAQLKSGKRILEGGLLPLGKEKIRVLPRLEEEEEETMEKESLEEVLYYHLSSLHQILQQLTQRANAVTSRYNEIMGQINRS